MPIASSDRQPMRSVIVTLGPPLDHPWWWDEVHADPDLCPLSFHRVIFNNKRAREVTTLELPLFFMKMLREYLRLRRRYDYIFTFECDLPTFALAFWQTVLLHARPKHVVLQFIMRERTALLASRLKYALMKWCFRSLHKVICSAAAEADYYCDAFGWPPGKTGFVPFHTSARIEAAAPHDDEGFILSAGRTFRDFPTLLQAVKGTHYRTILVVSHRAVTVPPDTTNVEVLEEVPQAEFERLVRAARVVVVPLQDTRISAGQLVILHAMAAAKPIIASRTSATVDYIVHEQNGVLVPPNDPLALRQAIDSTMGDQALRNRLGAAARRAVFERHLPQHYARAVRTTLAGRLTGT